MSGFFIVLNLFDLEFAKLSEIISHIPLAERMRPKSLEDFIGQDKIIGPQSNLRKSLLSGFIPSLIFWGPPGVGKTTLARLLAEKLDRPFYKLSAINSGVKEIRGVIDQVKKQGLFGGNNAVVFIDEIHRFSKSQQDSLLGAVENGTITLIGATTENPSFEVNSALLSRCQVYVLESLRKKDLELILNNAIFSDNLLSDKKIQIIETEELIRISGGDARKLLNAVEIVCSDQDYIEITNEFITDKIGKNLLNYDKSGEMHYDIISAFIKSIRGSDPNAAVYWLARMIEGGEDAKFIARRMVILASEDIGNANPNALVLANNTFQAVEVIGWPESRIVLSQCAIYLACSEKSNASYLAIKKAQDLVQKSGNLSVPMHLRNAPTQLMKELGYGNAYDYAHDFDNNFVEQQYLPKEIESSMLYEPGNNSRESKWKEKLRVYWKNIYPY